MDHINLWVDGAALGNPGPGGWAALLEHEGHRKLVSGGLVHVTNNQAELDAVIFGLQQLSRPCEVMVYSDSQYVVAGANGEWDINSNEELWALLDDLRKIHQVSFEWVKGHAGHPENEQCNRSANHEAAKEKRAQDVKA